jgi:hypothetical protein
MSTTEQYLTVSTSFKLYAKIRTVYEHRLNFSYFVALIFIGFCEFVSKLSQALA